MLKKDLQGWFDSHPAISALIFMAAVRITIAARENTAVAGRKSANPAYTANELADRGIYHVRKAIQAW